ncbi:MAG: hypothetical protein F4Y44_11755, partial [Chloroflexi bacterium]|nr:hypothetical protein [Chloroflexota bacterium]
LEHDDTFLMLGTRNGKIKRIALSSIGNIRPSGLIIMNMNSGPPDELVGTCLAKIEDDVVMVSEQGMAIRFSVENAPQRQRNSGGVKGMQLRDGDRVIAMSIIPDSGDSKLLVISKRGFGKLTPVSKYRRQGRGGYGLTTFDIQPRKTGPVAVAEVVDDSKELYLVSEQAQVLRTNLSEITTTIGRKTKGVTIFKLDKGDSVASIACVGDLAENGASATRNGKANAENTTDTTAAKPAPAVQSGAAKGLGNGTAKNAKPKNRQLSLDDVEQADNE